MITLSHKAKQYLLATLKVLILVITFGYIYLKLTNDESLPFSDFLTVLKTKDWNAFPLVLGFFGLAILNWVFEILKWQKVVSVVDGISFKTALKQSLTSLTVSLATPNRIGDYGAKAFFFPVEKRKHILLLNFFSNGVQMAITAFFGLIGLAFVLDKYNLSISLLNILLLGIVIVLLGFLGYLFKEKELILKGLSLSKVMAYIRKLSGGVKLRTLIYSLVRYASFSTLFFFLLKFFGSDLPFWQSAPIIYAMYLLVSIIPTVFIFDVVIRGGVGVWLFSLAGVPELTVLCAVLAMWLLNFVLPAIIGSFYVAKYRTS